MKRSPIKYFIAVLFVCVLLILYICTAQSAWCAGAHKEKAVKARIIQLVRAGEGELESFLETLSNAKFREAGEVLARDVVPVLPMEEMWSVVTRLTRRNNRAYLGTMLRGVAARSESADQTLFRCEREMALWAEGMTDLDRHKTLLALLPLASTPQNVSLLLSLFGGVGRTVGHGHDIDYLIATGTPAAYFVLLGYMRIGEHDKAMLTRIARRVMQRADSVAFNAASLFKAFFDLSDVHGTFSLQIEPYELGRLETDYGAFVKRIENRV